MQYRLATAACYLLAFIATATGAGSVRLTRRGAMRLSLGALRVYLDGDEVSVWTRGAASIHYTARAVIDAPAIVAAVPSIADLADVVLPAAPHLRAVLLGGPTRYSPPRGYRPAPMRLALRAA